MTGRTVNATSVVRNTLVNSAGGVVTALLAIVLTPVFLAELGPAEYGIWLVATVFTVTQGLGLADLGLRQTGVRFVADALGRNDPSAIGPIASTLLVLFAVVGIVVGGVVAVLAGTLTEAFSTPPDLAGTARLTFVLVGAQLPVDLAAGAFLAVVEGTQRYGLLRVADVGGRALWGVVSLILVTSGGGAVSVAAASLAIAILVFAYSAAAARHSLPGLVVRGRHATRRLTRELLAYGSGFTVMRVASVVYSQMDRVIVGSVLATAAVARYDVPYKVHAIAALTLSLVPSAILPASAFLGANDDRERLRTLYLRGSRYAVAICGPLALATLIYAEPLVRTWVEEPYWNLSREARVFLLYPMFTSFHVIGATMLAGLGKMRALVFLGTIPIGINLLLSLILVHFHGVLGVIVATQISYALAWLPYLLVSLRVFDVGWSQWCSGVLLPNLPGPVVQLGLGLATVDLVGQLDHFALVGGAILVNTAVSLGVFALSSMDRAERRSLLATVMPLD